MYEANWANNQQTAVYLAFEGAWGPDEFVDAEHALSDMLSEVGHSVSVVVHLAEPQPISMEMVPQIRNFISLEHPNRSQVVMVVTPDYLPGMSELVRRSFGGEVPAYLHFVSTLDEAETLLV